MAVDPRETTGFFLNDPQKVDNPYADFAYFRQNHPVFYYAPLNEWYVFKFDTVASLFVDPRLGNGLGALLDAAPPSMHDDLKQVAGYLNLFIVVEGGATHTRMRAFMNRAFSGAIIEGLSAQIQQITNELLDHVRGQRGMDAGTDFTIPLPAYVLCDFLGVPREDRDRLVQWSGDFVDFFNVVPPTVDTSQRLVRSGLELADYTKQLLADRRVHPRDDLLGTLAKSQSEPGGLTDDEIIGNALMLLVAGHISVRNLIGNAIYLLLTHPDQRTKLQAQPALLGPTIEEALRYEAPVATIARIAEQDFTCEGNAIQKGQVVQLSISSANRDEAHFPNADTFDVTRPPSRMLSFGSGPHACIGAHLAREEARIALSTLFQRLPNLRLDASRPTVWKRDAGNRGPMSLPVLF
jgi:cytochrome P450